MKEHIKSTENNSNLGNITIIILSSISLVFILSTTKTPNSYLVEPEKFNTGDEFIVNVKDRGEGLDSTSTSFFIKSESELSSSTLSTSEIFAESFNKEAMSNIHATVLENGQIIVTETKGKLISFDKISSILVEDTPTALLQDYFKKIAMVLVLFFMIFYLVRSTVPLLNTGRKLKDETNFLESSVDNTLDSAQEMDKDIHTEALMRMSKTTDMVLDEYERGDFSKITVVSRDLASDIDNIELQKQVVRNILKGVKYRWIISSNVGRGPFDQLLLALLDSYKTLREDKNENIGNKNIKDCFDCLIFYSVDAIKFLSLPYELNFYFSKNDHQMIAFEKDINLNLSNCCKVNEIKKNVDNWMVDAESNSKDWLYVDDCNNGISCSSDKPENASVVHYSENLKESQDIK